MAGFEASAAEFEQDMLTLTLTLTLALTLTLTLEQDMRAAGVRVVSTQEFTPGETEASSSSC